MLRLTVLCCLIFQPLLIFAQNDIPPREPGVEDQSNPQGEQQDDQQSRRQADQDKVGAPAGTATPANPAAFQKVTVRFFAKGSGTSIRRVEARFGDQRFYSDKGGTLELNIPTRGDGNIVFYKSGFEQQTKSLKELREAKAEDIYLFPAAPGDNEVIVRGIRRPEASRKKVSVQEADRVAPGGDPAQVPKLLPGVQTQNFQPGVIVRGSGPEDSQYFVDDQQVPFIFHSIGNISVLPPQLLDDVEFSTGGFGPQYGNATGGVIVLQTKSEVVERPLTEFRVNVPFYSGIYHERPLGDQAATLALSARRSTIEFILPAILKQANDDGVDLTLVPYFGDAHLFYFRPIEKGHVKLLTLYAFDGLKLAVPTEFSDDEDGRGNFDLLESATSLGFEWKRVLNKDQSLTLTPQISTRSTRFDVLDNFFELRTQQAKLKSELTHKRSRREKVYVGGEVNYAKVHVDILAPNPDPDDPFFDFEEAPKRAAQVDQAYHSTAAWVSADQQWRSWMFTPGVRVFNQSVTKRSGVDPRLNARKKMGKEHTLKIAVGQYSQLPDGRETSESFGNPNLHYIRSNHYILGVETSWSRRWTTDIQGFYKTTYNLVRSDPETNTNNDGSALATGLEVFIRRNLTERLFGWLSYTYSRNFERDSDQETFRNSQYDQTHIATFVTNYKVTATWEVGTRIYYHTGNTFTRVDEAVYNANLDKYQPRNDEDSRLFNDRLPDYHQVDLFANKDFLFDTWKMALRFGVFNLAMEPQAQDVQYNYDYSEKEFFRGLPPIPYVEIRGTL